MDLSDNLTAADVGVPGGAAIDKTASFIKNLFQSKKKKLNYSPPSGYTEVCNENETVNFPGTVDIAYGVNGAFLYQLGVSGAVTFSNAYFGGLDPAPNKVKAGYAKSSNYAVKSGILDSNMVDVKTNVKYGSPILGVVGGTTTASGATKPEVKATTGETLKKYIPYAIGAVLLVVIIWLIAKK